MANDMTQAVLNGEIPVITMWRPWANWVSCGWKTIETRTHNRFRALAGKNVAIHCGLKNDEMALELADPYLSDARKSVTRNYLNFGGFVICVVHVKEFRELTREDSHAALIDCGSTKRYGLVLDDVYSIDAIPARGKQGIWYYKH